MNDFKVDPEDKARVWLRLRGLIKEGQNADLHSVLLNLQIVMNLVITELRQELLKPKRMAMAKKAATEPVLSVPTPRSLLEEFLSAEGNNMCADCAEPHPGWASVNLGVLICTQCAGVHRSLGVEKSFVLSLTLDEWTHEQVDAVLMKGGNARINKEWEHCVPKVFEAPQGGRTSRSDREQFIAAKYVEELFRFREGVSGAARPPKRDLSSPSPPSSPASSRSRSSSGSSFERVDYKNHVAMVEFRGIVSVQLVEARGLIEKDLVKSDPYFILKVGLQKHKSSVKKRTINPKYNENFQFSWDGSACLFLEVFDKDSFTRDDHMGVCEVQLSSLMDGRNGLAGWYPVTHRKHRTRQQGEVYMRVDFTPIQ